MKKWNYSLNYLCIMKDMLLKLPTPSSITNFWSFGSLLGVYLGVQIISGIMLSMHYKCSVDQAFWSVEHIMLDINWGWLLRFIHSNGATFFFFFIYLHIGRGIFYMSFTLSNVWVLGVMIYLLFMGVAFMGYVLPWGQMSYWGATVITNLISATPWLGVAIVEWVWGSFSVSEPTLMRFFSFHFILPFVGLVLVLGHLFFLHITGSKNPLGLDTNTDKISFHPFFTVKDVMGFTMAFFGFAFICLKFPFMFMDPDNFIEANSLVTPVHIQPEWYFLFAYAILRSVPSKMGGVITMILSITILIALTLKKKSSNLQNKKLYEFFCVFFYINFILLTWIGSLPVEIPYVLMGQVLSFTYFITVLSLTIL